MNQYDPGVKYEIEELHAELAVLNDYLDDMWNEAEAGAHEEAAWRIEEVEERLAQLEIWT